MFGERVGEFDFPGRSLEDVRIDARVRSALRTAVWDVVGVDVGAIALSEGRRLTLPLIERVSVRTTRRLLTIITGRSGLTRFLGARSILIGCIIGDILVALIRS